MSEPFSTVRFTTLGRGYDPSAVEAFVAAVARRLLDAEMRAALLVAAADAAEIRRGGREEVARIHLRAYAEIAAIHERAVAQVEAFQAGRRDLTRLLDDVDGVLAARTGEADDIHIVFAPEEEAALDPAPGP